MAKKIIEILDEIRNMRENLAIAVEQEKFATEPLLHDYSMMTELHRIFCDTLGTDFARTTLGRKIFTFIALYLYAPRKFFGGRMPKGLRPAIGRVTGTTVTTLSKSSELLILYLNYADFRHHADAVYNNIAENLNLNN